MKLLRHQPLLVWSVVLVALLSILLLGVRDPSGVNMPAPAVPRASSGYPVAQDLLERLQQAYGLSEAAYLEWAEEFGVTAREGQALYGSEHEDAWADVVVAVAVVESLDPSDRGQVVPALSELGRVVMNLNREYVK